MSKNLGVIVCPILEDELVYNISQDKDKKNVFILENTNSYEISRKLIKNNIPFETLDEQEFLRGLVRLPEDEFNIIIQMKGMKLHADPKMLKETLRESLHFMQTKVDAIALYYGVCGNANNDIIEWASDNIDKPVAIFRDASGKICDDCIGVAVGGNDRYFKMQKAYSRSLYYTPAMATKWRDFYKDVFKGVEETGFGDIKQLFSYLGYNRVLKISTGLGDEEDFDRSLNEFANELGLEIVDIEPDWVGLGPTERLYADAKSLMNEK